MLYVEFDVIMEKLIRHIVSALDKNLSLTQDQREVTEYALYNIFLTTGILLAVTAGGMLLGALPEATAALVTGSVFRWSTGGVHCSTPYRCMLVSATLPLIVALISRKAGTLFLADPGSMALLPGIILFVLSGVIIYVYAPAETENKRISPRQRPKLRFWAYVTLMIWAAAMVLFYRQGKLTLVVASCLGIIWQMLSVAPAGHRMFTRIEAVFDYLERSTRRGGN